jgi:hypothetical protein
VGESYDGSRQTAATLMRFVGATTLRYIRSRVAFRGRYGAGAKVYFADSGRLADELVQLASAGLQLRWGKRMIQLSGNYYDAFLRQPADCGAAEQPPCPLPRDFRIGEASLGLAGVALGMRAQLSLGYQRLEFKPDGAFSYHAPVANLQIRRALYSGEDNEVEWGIRFSYRVALRGFGGKAQLPAPCSDPQKLDCIIESGEARRDFFQSMRIELDYLGSAEANLFYSLDINDSNSYGESYLRHAVGLQFTASLFFGLFMTATAVLQLSSFSDPLFASLTTQGLVDIDLENRSRLLIHLARDVWRGWSVSFRYAVYVSESGTNSEGQSLPGFLRQTVFFSVRYEYDSTDE